MAKELGGFNANEPDKYISGLPSGSDMFFCRQNILNSILNN
jgi:hypothetical protein